MVIAHKFNQKGIRSQDYCFKSTGNRPRDIIKNALRDSSIMDHIEPNGDPAIWLFEHLRMICMELNDLYVLMMDECDMISCPEMKAGDWLYYCAAHESTKACSAIEYMCHTLDQAADIFAQSEYRNGNILDAQMKEMEQIARRLYRIFAHSFFHHQQIFHDFEAERNVYEWFVSLGLRFQLLNEKTLIIKKHINMLENK